MRIGIEAQRIFREKKHGMDMVALELIRALQRLDTENQYFILVNDGPDEACLAPAANFEIIRHKALYPIWEQVWLPRVARELKLDMLHCTSNTAPLSIPIPLLVTIHDLIYLERHPLVARGYNLYQRFGNLYRRWVVKRLLARAHRIFTVSHYEAQHFKKYPQMAPERLAVVYNGVGPHFKPVDDQQALQRARRNYGLPENFVLFLGNTDPKKNTRRTVQAFGQFCRAHGRHYKLVVGDFAPELIRRYLDEAGLQAYFDQFVFTGYVPNGDMPLLHNLADLYLYTSLRESFGIPILEAMACGTPVITSDRASMPEVAGDAAYLVDPTSTEEMVDTMARVLLNDDTASLVEAGLKRAKNFTWEAAAQDTLDHYKTLFGPKQ